MNPELISCGVNVVEVKTVLGNKKIVKTFYRLGSVFLLVFFGFGLPGYSGCSRLVRVFRVVLVFRDLKLLIVLTVVIKDMA